MSRRRGERSRNVRDSVEHISPHPAAFRNVLGFARLKQIVISEEDIGLLHSFYENLREKKDAGLKEEAKEIESKIKELLGKYGISMEGVPKHFWKPIFEAADRRGIEFTREDRDTILRLCDVLEDVAAKENPDPQAYSLTVEELNAVLQKYNLVYT